MSLTLSGSAGITFPDGTLGTSGPAIKDLTNSFSFSTTPQHLNFFTGSNTGYLSIKIGGLPPVTASNAVNEGYMRVVITQDDRDLSSVTNPPIYEFVFKGNMQNGVWYNTQAVIVGASQNQPIINVRFTRTTLDAYIEIGDATTVWQYATVNIYNTSSYVISGYTPTYSTSIQSTLKGTQDSLITASMSVNKLTTAQNISLSGDVSGSASFDGSAAANITATLANSGVTSGSYGSSTNIPQISIDGKGRITSASNVAVSIPSGSLTFTGDVTGSGSTGSSTALTLANSGVTSGSYTKVTVDSKGRVTSGGSLSSSDISTALGGVSAATTSYVDTAISNLINGAPAALDTLKEISNQLASDESVVSALVTTVALKAPLASPTFTGTVSGITKSMVGLGNVENTTLSTWAGTSNITTVGAVSGTSFNSITGLSSSTTSLTSGGTGAIGTSTAVARQDHTHTLPAYPTTLPASDVYAWAKASTKPTYSYSEVNAPSTTGTNASGSWGISITGSSASCTGNSVTATTATSLSGGSAGTIPYQTAAGVTAQLAAGTSGQFLKSNGTSAPSWVSPSEVIGLTDLNNVAISSPTSGEVLSYNGTNWVNSASFSSSSDVTFNSVSAYNFYSLSDVTLKENVKTIENGLEVVKKLNPVTFNWKENGKETSGLIAQELENILPSLVNTGEYKTVNYDGLIAYLICAVKELSAEIQVLKGV